MNTTQTSAFDPISEDQTTSSDKELSLAQQFAGQNSDYYAEQFEQLGNAANYRFTFNLSAALFGPVWLAARGLWAWFWPFLIAEAVMVVQICRGLFGNLGADQLARAERLSAKAEQRFQQARIAIEEGSINGEILMNSAQSFQAGALKAEQAAAAASAGGVSIMIVGLLLLIAIKAIQGSLANWLLEQRFMQWRSDRSIRSGLSVMSASMGALMMALVYPLAAYRFTATEPPHWLLIFPADRSWHTGLANWVDGLFSWLTLNGEGLFDGIRDAIRILLDATEVVLVDTPWPIVMLVIIVLAWRLAGPRVTLFTVGALAYLALFGFWEKSMATVALLGTASFICVLFGVPLGIWCAKNEKVYATVRPILDFMQTMPAFVYLIPVIAFFGTGKPPGIIATIIFGMPPVVRLTALGMQGVPDTVREAATAFGASKWFLLFKVDIPLAMPSIMAGINQTILMCLSMVVIASLIGAKGLGEDVLSALQYAAQGQGVIAGLAILACAMVLDRIIQGNPKKRKAK
ncbi:ABC transporter permease [Aliamphritea ceti]|uniref:ABC transporter permease n=1 Tax=Aliamphritea ceti TaxID=1524258 RepID=UPI0021C2576B|nr:proline/glycine betaine ABC transporter permease [Aliamphritea ceti]